MPIEIGELEIKAHIEENPGSENSDRYNQLKNEEIIQEAVERVLEILRRRSEL